MVHTTGSGIPDKAVREGVDIVEMTHRVYSGMREGPHFVIVPDGRVFQYRQLNEKAWHAGVDGAERRDYLSGNWLAKVAKGVASWWKARWVGIQSPQHLYPSTSPNEDYVGIELVPCVAYVKGNNGSLKPVFGEPAGPGQRFTAQQYTSLAMLVNELSSKYGIPLSGGRLVGHEDIDPMDRPGWDPGDMHGYFSWSLLRGIIAGLTLQAVNVSQ